MKEFASGRWDIKTDPPSPEMIIYVGGVKIVTWNDGELIHNVSYEFINGRWECMGDKTIKPQPQ